jgi:hypothetical protein
MLKRLGSVLCCAIFLGSSANAQSHLALATIFFLIASRLITA